jgi:hypothetical protein
VAGLESKTGSLENLMGPGDKALLRYDAAFAKAGYTGITTEAIYAEREAEPRELPGVEFMNKISGPLMLAAVVLQGLDLALQANRHQSDPSAWMLTHDPVWLDQTACARCRA